MPDVVTVEKFMALVEAGDFIAALERFYHDDAATRENGDAPIQGLQTLLAKERGVLASNERVRCERLGPAAVTGDQVAIAWRFTFEPKAGGRRKTLEEIAWQRWEGNRIREERFFYDPRQMA